MIKTLLQMKEKLHESDLDQRLFKLIKSIWLVVKRKTQTSNAEFQQLGGLDKSESDKDESHYI